MIEIDRLAIRLGAFDLSGVSFTVPAGEYGVLMGRTGCGKTTILEAVCGLKIIHSGTIRLAGRDVTKLPPASRGVGYVPQDGALFSSMNVRDHLALALEIRKWPRAKIDARVRELAHLLGIEHLLKRRPFGLSGGERQRVALGRALSARPVVLCLDEPLSALDDETREEMYHLLQSVKNETGVTALHVTHNREEAEVLADRFFTFRDGNVIERQLSATKKDSDATIAARRPAESEGKPS